MLRIGEVSSLVSSSAMLAIDCEMVLCDDGTEAVVRVCVVDNNLEVVRLFSIRSLLRFLELSGALIIRILPFHSIVLQQILITVL